MAIISQRQLFSWKEIEDLVDLERFSMLLKYLPDEKLMKTLDARRKRGRDDYPVRAIWNSILAGIVYQHPSIESLRRELMRNAQLRQLCGFDLLKGLSAIPSSNAYSNFLKLLLKQSVLIEETFYGLVEKLRELLPAKRPGPATTTTSIIAKNQQKSRQSHKPTESPKKERTNRMHHKGGQIIRTSGLDFLGLRWYTYSYG